MHLKYLSFGVTTLLLATMAIGLGQTYDYKLVAANKTSTAQKEINQAAEEGFRFRGVMGGSSTFGGGEVVIIMQRSSNPKTNYEYKLLATSKTSTMQKELQEAGDAGFEYCGQTVYGSTFGGQEVVIIMEKDPGKAIQDRWEYLLLATKKTSTMQKELTESGGERYEFVGVTVSKTMMAGSEVISILRRKVAQ